MTKPEARKTAVRVNSLIANCSDSHSEIAAKMTPPVDKSLVTRWRSGTRKPTDAQLARLEELYGSLASPAPPPPSLPDVDDDDSTGRKELPVDEHADEDNHARLRRYIRDGMRELQHEEGLSGVKRAEALKKLADAQVALDRSTGENALTLQKIAAHPEYVRIAKMITDALVPYPDALAAVIRVLEAARP